MESGTLKCWGVPAPSVPSCIKGLACGFSPGLVLGCTWWGRLAVALLGTPTPGLVGSCIPGFGVLALGLLGVMALRSWVWGSSGSWLWGHSGSWLWVPDLESWLWSHGAGGLGLGFLRVLVLDPGFELPQVPGSGVIRDPSSGVVWDPGSGVPRVPSSWLLTLNPGFGVLALGSQLCIPAQGSLRVLVPGSWVWGLSGSWFWGPLVSQL